MIDIGSSELCNCSQVAISRSVGNHWDLRWKTQDLSRLDALEAIQQPLVIFTDF